jgi:branched-chain amino acid transport system substrate-binding protein
MNIFREGPFSDGSFGSTSDIPGGPQVKIRLVKAVVSAMAGVAGLSALVIVPTTTASAAGPPIKIAMITSETGIAASEFATTPQGFLSRVDLQNAQGGINGRKIDPIVINDQGSLTTVVTAVQQAISQGAVGIVNATPFFFNAYKFAQQAHIPVTGGSFDGSEWGQQPNTNMFASDTGSVDPTFPINTGLAAFFKAHGGTVLGTYGYGVSESSARAASGTGIAAKAIGMRVGVVDTSVPFGGVAFTTEALAAKQAGVNTLYGTMDDNSNFALLTAMQQAGVKLKVVEFPTGYEPGIIHAPIWKSVQGVYFSAEFRPFSLPNAGTRQMAAALQKYAHRKPSDFPTYNIYEGWMGADLMIKGIQLAGKNVTSANIIKQLRQVKNYSGNGILPYNIDYFTIFGHNPPQSCGWYMKAVKNGFVATTRAPVCSGYIAHSGTPVTS